MSLKAIIELVSFAESSVNCSWRWNHSLSKSSEKRMLLCLGLDNAYRTYNLFLGGSVLSGGGLLLLVLTTGLSHLKRISELPY